MGGPDNTHGVNWRVDIPKGCKWVDLIWDPTEPRRFEWLFINPTGGTMRPPAQVARRSLPFFLVGSWDEWKKFVELTPKNTRDQTYCARIAVRTAPGVEEFQVVQDRNWDKRFFPASADPGAAIKGPGIPPHGRSWRVEIPEGVKWLYVVWDPSGER